MARALVLVVALGLVLSVTSFAQAPEPVSLRLDWSVTAYHGPYYLALERGWYREAGLALTIQEGKGSGNTVQLVGNGSDTFGWADAAVAARSASLGVPVKVVMGVIRRGPASLAFPGDRGINAPADLKGRTVATCAGHGALTLLPAYLKAINLAMTDIKLVTTDCNGMYPLIAAGKADVATGYTPGSKARFALVGVTNMKAFDYADVGVLLPSHSLLAGTKTIETKPHLVKGFVAASQRAWLETRKNPEPAIEALVRAFPILKGKEAVLRTELEDYGKYMDTPGTAGKPFGWQSPEEWKKAEALLVQYMEMKPAASVDTYFTNAFIAP